MFGRKRSWFTVKDISLKRTSNAKAGALIALWTATGATNSPMAEGFRQISFALDEPYLLTSWPYQVKLYKAATGYKVQVSHESVSI